MTYYYLHMRKSASVFIAQHIMMRLFEGRIMIVTDEPQKMYAPFRRQWKKQLASRQREFSMTLDPELRADIRGDIDQMNRLTCGYHASDDKKLSDILFVRPDEVDRYLAGCRTLYVDHALFLANFDHYASTIDPDGCIFSVKAITVQEN